MHETSEKAILDHSDDCLRPVTYAELDQLVQLFAANLPRAHTAHLFVLHQRRYFRLFANNSASGTVPQRMRFTIYTPRTGELLANATIVAFSRGKRFLLFMFTLQISHDELRIALADTQRIPWHDGFSCNALADNLRPLINAQMLRIDAGYSLKEYQCNILLLPADRAAQFADELPVDVAIAELNSGAHAEYINEVWPHRDPESGPFVRGMIELNGGLGVFRKGQTECEQQPMSWVLMNEFQGMGLLQTAVAERKKGYAQLVVRAFCRRVAVEHGAAIVAFVIDTNEASNGLLGAQGFERVGHCVFLDYKCD